MFFMMPSLWVESIVILRSWWEEEEGREEGRKDLDGRVKVRVGSDI